MTSIADRRLGLRTIVRDHVDTWSWRVGREGARERRRTALWYFAVPTAVAAPFLRWHLELQSVGQLLSGVAVFTALLFGLLVLMFNTGVALRKDRAQLSSAHQVQEVVADLRANVTYAILVAVSLSIVLVTAAALTPSSHGLAWGWTPVIVWLFVHLGLTMLTILRGFRTAFNLITR